MNAPDKIYVFQHGINAFDPLWHFTKSKEKHTESHEYIRKEALLEWAKEWHERYPYSHEFEMIIDKIESL